MFHVSLLGQVERALDTKSAESLVLQHYSELGVGWLPVPHPGGERQLEQTLQRMAKLSND